ncbi:MAG: aldo/keto reductase [Acetobacter sp.]|nr:aldo/keto reductase [Acetobacter sp.]
MMRYVELNNETKMPILGLGTWKSELSDVYSAVRWALKLGYSHFDCAAVYNNEEAIGQAFADAMREDDLQREDIFVTSKLWNNMHKPEDVKPALQETLKRLKLEYLDLYLVHWPVAQKKEAVMPLKPEDMLSLEEVPLSDTWGAMEELYNEGLCKAIGVSNFGSQKLTELMMTAEVNPMVNQVESHPYLPQNELLEFCKKNMIAMTAYAPLGSGSSIMLEDETVRQIAEKNKATPAQVLLAWNMARGVAVIPKAVNEQHLQENIASLNVTLDEADIAALSELNKNERFLTADVFEIGAYKGSDVFL